MLMRRVLLTAALLVFTAAAQAAQAPVWTADVKGIQAAPALIHDGARSLAVVIGDDGLVALDAQGGEVWRNPAIKGGSYALAVAEGPDGRSLLFGARGRTVVAVDAAGRSLWQVEVADKDGASCAVVAARMPDGGLRVLTGDWGGQVRCFEAGAEGAPEGRLLWSFQFQTADRPRTEDEAFDKERGLWGDYYRADAVTGIAAQPLSPPGAPGVFVTAEFGRVYALDWEGRYLWDCKLPSKALRSGPVLAQLAGKATVLVGCMDFNLYALDAQSGKRLWSAPATFTVFTPTVADVDGDGEAEVVYSDENCRVFCVEADGSPKWRCDLSKPRTVAYHGRRTVGPARVFESDDGVRIAVPMKNDRSLPLLDGATGAAVGALQFEADDVTPAALESGGPQGTPLVADLGQGPVLVGAGVRSGVRAFAVPGGRAPAAPSPPALAPVKYAMSEHNALSVSVPAGLAVGPNEITFAFTEYRQPATLALAIRSPLGFETRRCNHLAPGQQVVETIEVLEPGETAIEARLIDPVTRRWLGEWQAALPTVSLAPAVADEIARLEAAARSLRPENPGAAEFLHRQAMWAKGEAAALTPEALGSEAAEVLSERARAVRDALARLSAGAEALLAADAEARGQRVQMWPAANPWERFYPDHLPEKVGMPQPVSVTLAQNEYESAAFNLTNWSDETITVRLEPGPFGPAGDEKRTTDWRDHLALHAAQLVPVSRGYYVADALPPLGDAGLVTIAPWQSAHIWLTFRAGELDPGVYAGDVTVSGLTLDPLVLTVPFEMRVRGFALPREKPVRFCNWAYVERNKWFARCVDDAVRDMVEHGTSVFPEDLRSPVFEYEEAGAVAPPSEADWAGLDEIALRYKPHGIILFQGAPGVKYAGSGPEPEGARDKAYAAAWRAVVRHLQGLGVGYDDWAWYVTDEPGLHRGPRIETVVNQGKRLRAIDPQIRIYTDPVSPTGLPDLERMDPYIDVWQPDQETFAPVSDPLPEFQPDVEAAWFRATGEPFWTYECHPRMKRGHPLMYYRRISWVAWKYGMTGIGFWTYDTTSDDHWYQIANGHEYALVYPGETPVPSKRWEAVRDGIEDFTYLWLLDEIVDDALNRGLSSADLDRADRLVSEAAADLVAHDMDFELLMRYRTEIADLIERLQ